MISADSNKLMLIDTVVIVIVSIAISVASNRLVFMSFFVPAIIISRMILLYLLQKEEAVNFKAEVVFLLICILLGGFNDWNSVCNKKIYDYSVPVFFESFSTIPLWMLLFWGMILRYFARLARWQRLNPPDSLMDKIGIGSTYVENNYFKIGAELILVLVTRQFIYRNYLDPIWSWLPFAAAIIIFMLFFYPTRHDFLLLIIFVIGGPLIEILYIKVGHLHYYHLGWIFGIPLWLALWWMLIIIIWKDISLRLEEAIKSGFTET